VINAIKSSTEKIGRNETSIVSRVGGRKNVIESGKKTCFSRVARMTVLAELTIFSISTIKLL
jgi:hypothetical protein